MATGLILTLVSPKTYEHLKPNGFLSIGILFLLLVPVIQVVVQILLFVKMQDTKYIIITVLVLIFTSVGFFLKSPEARDLSVGYGLTVRQLTPDFAMHIGFDETNGVLIVDVEGDSIAKKAGIKSGDIITRVGSNNDISAPIDFYKIFHKYAKEKKPVTIQIYSKGFVTLI